MSGVSLRAAIDGKCRDCGACEAGANWREHVSCCPVVDCALWRVRPLTKAAPEWLASRNAGALPSGWCDLPLQVALAKLRNGHASGPQDSAKPSCGDKAGNPAIDIASAARSAPSGPVAVLQGGALC